MNRHQRKFLFISFSLFLTFSAVSPAFATQDPSANPRKSQWTAEQTPQDDMITVEPNETGDSTEQIPTIQPENKQEYAPDRIIVKYKTTTASASTFASPLSTQVVSVRKLNSIGAEVLNLSAGADINSVIEELKKDPNVLYAEPDYKFYIANIEQPTGLNQAIDTYLAVAAPELPNDPLFHEQWGLHNTGQILNGGEVPGGTPDIDIDAPEAWEITQGSSDVVVAVIASGVKTDIPELKYNIWENPGEVPGDQIDNDGNGLVDDTNGWDFFYDDNSLFDLNDGIADFFGTYMAGLIASSMNNNEGIAGVAPNVKIMPLKVSSNAGGHFSDLIDAIHYAESKGVKIANLGIATDIYSKALEDAIGSSQMLFVVPAGEAPSSMNIDIQRLYPASFASPNILTVTGVNILGELALQASFGQASVDVAAPSELILTTAPDVNIGYAAEIDNGTYKAIYHGIGFEEIPVYPEEFAGQQQDMFNRAMDFLKPDNGDTPSVLLVQDNKGLSGGIIIPFEEDYKDPTLKIYEDLLMNAGYTYDVETVQDETQDGPSFDKLKEYDIVVWFTGTTGTFNDEIKLITDNDQANLTNYLNGGGHLMLTGQDAIDHLSDSAFVRDVLHLVLVGQGGVFESTTGVPGSIYADQFYKLYDFALFYDIVLSNDPSITKINLKNKAGLYSFRQGTSYASSYAAGVAALVLSQNPYMSSVDIKQRVTNSGKALSSLTRTTASGRMISAHRALWDKDIPGTPLRDSAVSNTLDAASNPDHVYSIELHTGENVNLSLTGDAGTDFDLILYSPAATTISKKENALVFSENPNTSNESIIYTATETGTYYINVYAYEGAGKYTLSVNSGNQSGLFEDVNESLLFEGSWSSLSKSAYSGGALKQIDAQGSVEFGFRGNVIEWIGSKNDSQGIANVYIDGLIVASPSLFSKSSVTKQSIFKKSLPNGHHSIRIEWTGQRDPLSKKPKAAINVDAFIVTNLISSLHPSTVFKGPWGTNYGLKFTDGIQRFTTTPDSSVEFTFTGTRVTLWSNIGKNRGKANIYIDDKLVTDVPIDMYSEKIQYQVPVFTSGDLPNGTHKIKIVHAGQKNERSTNSVITIDALDVLNLS
ncbi:S8 family serine peptidase [Cohnella luojiensis]|uniref:Peptidase n=1 Tax=Cohnella luojiensis TaxID=652876 RepID=A0A4Y8LNK1_9BACL|nr:S8 family serine peptidase [Cohnella luojiensis]TFE22571.1 hypothetical protein E2980_21510 [Cohnella luojiensis]